MLKVYGVKVDLTSTSVLMRYLDALPAYQKSRIERFKNDKAKKLSLCGAALLKYALGKEGINEYDIQINDYGKPYLKNETIQFNISHSANRVICAISDKEVGCDVQETEDFNPNIPRRFFSKEECDIIFTADDERDMFYRLWAIRESFIKATGYGMAYCQDKFKVLFTKNNTPRIEQNIDDREYYIREIFIEKDYKYALCSQSPNDPDFSWADLNTTI